MKTMGTMSAPSKIQNASPMMTKPTNFGEGTLCPRDYEGKAMSVTPDDATYKSSGGWSFTDGMRGDRDQSSSRIDK